VHTLFQKKTTSGCEVEGGGFPARGGGDQSKGVGHRGEKDAYFHYWRE